MKKVKPVLGFVKERMCGLVQEGEYYPWMGYIHGDQVWVAEYSEEGLLIDSLFVTEESLRKVIPKGHIDIVGRMNLAKDNYKLSKKLIPLSELENSSFWPALTVEELEILRKRSISIMFHGGPETSFIFKPL